MVLFFSLRWGTARSFYFELSPLYWDQLAKGRLTGNMDVLGGCACVPWDFLCFLHLKRKTGSLSSLLFYTCDPEVREWFKQKKKEQNRLINLQAKRQSCTRGGSFVWGRKETKTERKLDEGGNDIRREISNEGQSLKTFSGQFPFFLLVFYLLLEDSFDFFYFNVMLAFELRHFASFFLLLFFCLNYGPQQCSNGLLVTNGSPLWKAE